MTDTRERTAKEKELKMSCKTCKFYTKKDKEKSYKCENKVNGNANKICYLWERKDA